MSTGKTFLKNELGYSDSELGEIWNGWEENLGMTYTQLEFFAANLVGKNDKARKKCVCRFVEREAEVSQQRYVAYLKTLRKKHFIDWGEFEDEKVGTIRLVIDYALRRRDERSRIPSDVDLREAITRSLAVCDSDARQKGLTKSSYKLFYQTLVPRLFEPLFVLQESTRSAGINADIRERVLINKYENQYSIVLQAPDSAIVLRLNENFKFDYSEHFELEPSDCIVSVTDDGKALLVQREEKWVLLHGADTYEYTNPDLKLSLIHI